MQDGDAGNKKKPAKKRKADDETPTAPENKSAVVETPRGFRAKLWLDDLVGAVSHAEREFGRLMIDSVPPEVIWRCKRELYSIAIEFAFMGTISLNGRTYRAWSGLRAALQQNLLKTIQQASAELPESDTSSGLVAKLANHLQASERNHVAKNEILAESWTALGEFVEARAWVKQVYIRIVFNQTSRWLVV